MGFRRGALRHSGWLTIVVIAVAMLLLGGKTGGGVGLLLLVVRILQYPPRHAAVVYFRHSAGPSRRRSTPCLWLDSQRLVLGTPYRVIYRDEVRPAEFARLRRLCRGLPE